VSKSPSVYGSSPILGESAEAHQLARYIQDMAYISIFNCNAEASSTSTIEYEDIEVLGTYMTVTA
jgi:hypothetical protein